MSKPKRLEVREVGDGFAHVPWGVYLGRILVSRHASEEDASRIRDKLNAKIERRRDVVVLASVLGDILKSADGAKP